MLDSLKRGARDSYQKAYAPYSNKTVGVAILTENDEIILGCNVENKITAVRLCAERNAISSAITKGKEKITYMVIIGETIESAIPCDFCRLVINELCISNMPILLMDTAGREKLINSKDLKAKESSKEMLKFLVKNIRKEKHED